MMNNLITVIITAYNRKTYLLQAVNSVLGQTLDKNYYEIIVTKNFVEQEIENYLLNNNVRVLDSASADQGKQLSSAISASNGDIIALLDDDDLFSKDKLESILYYFQSNPDLIYTHNQYKTLRKSALSGKTLYRYIKNDVYIKGGNLDILKRYLKYGVWSNNSSICFRKSFIMKHLKILKEIKSRIDFFIFFIAVIDRGDLMLLSSILTTYRIHESESHSLKTNSIKDQRVLLLLRYAEVDKLLLEIPLNIEVKKLIRMDELIITMNLKILGEKGENLGFRSLPLILDYVFVYRKLYPIIISSFYLASLISKYYTDHILRKILLLYYKNFY
ncbi:MAG: glycosyltransferase [Thermoplasmatales archaeon]